MILIIFSIVSAAVISQMMLTKTTDHTLGLIDNQLEKEKSIVNNITETKVNDTINTSVLLAEQISYQPEVIKALKENNPAGIHAALKNTVKAAKEKANIDLIWVTRLQDRKSDGATPIFACPSIPSYDGYDQLNYKSVNEAMDTGKSIPSWEVNEEDGKLQVTAPIIDQGKVIGAVIVGQTAYQNFIRTIAESAGTSATLFVTNNQKDFHIMTDTQSDDIGNQFFDASLEKDMEKAQSVSDLAKDNSLYESLIPYLDKSITSSKAFTETLKLNNQLYVMQFKPLLTSDEKVAAVYVTRFPGFTGLKEEIMDQTKSSQTLFYAIAIALILLSILISIIVSRKISNPIVHVTNHLEKLADGDLRGENFVVNNQDEVGRLVQALNTMVGNLRQLIGKTTETTSQVAAASEELSASAEQTSRATEQIASTIQQVATGTENQVRSTGETSLTVNELSIGVQQIATNSQSVANTATEALHKAGEGNESIQTAIKQMNSINVTVTGLGQVITNLGKRSKEIGEIIQVITGISEQTNLLALNAAIEAARAGEQGKGFAVVADEVRKLAEQSSMSAQQISQLISAIQSETNKAVTSMEQATREVIAGIQVVELAGISFEHIQHSVNDVAGQIQEVSSAVQLMSAGTEQMVDSVKLITEMTEMTSAGTQEVSAATEEQLASMEEITHSSASLSKMAEELQEVVGRFKV